MDDWQLNLGAACSEEGTAFRVWAPPHHEMSIEIQGKGKYAMQKDPCGYFNWFADGVKAGERYYYSLGNGKKMPDPVSRSLPEGVHGPTEIIDPQAFSWTDSHWRSFPVRNMIFYEIHVGTFTEKGTFEGAAEKLPYLKELGINCIEIMPVIQFPGKWNWGYDGASLYAPYSGYGGPAGLKRFVDTCHRSNIAVCLDVVYNHLGPEGNYLESFGPYFSPTYHTLWGKAFNYDGAYSDAVRHFVIQNALYWIHEYHVDALRLDALHEIYDFSPIPMVADLVKAVETVSKDLNREIHVIAECDRNNSRLIRSRKEGGYSFSAVWNDDYHHAVHTSLTDEKFGYYQDFEGIEDAAKAISKGFVFDGKYSSFRKKIQGSPTEGIPLDRFVAFIQNHDQVGNRPKGERLSSLVNFNSLKLAPFFCLLTPALPLLFMGEEYGEKSSFRYFVDFGDSKLMQDVFGGRKQEFQCDDMLFPGEESFLQSRIAWKIENQGKELLDLYKHIIALRKANLPKAGLKEEDVFVNHSVAQQWIAWEFPTEDEKWLGVICHLGKDLLVMDVPFKNANHHFLLGSEPMEWSSPVLKLPPESACVISGSKEVVRMKNNLS